MTQMGIDNINALLDSFMGINDSELAEQVRQSYTNNINCELKNVNLRFTNVATFIYSYS